MVAPPRCVLSGSAVFVNDVACEVASSYLQHALLIPLKDISITKSEPDRAIRFLETVETRGMRREEKSFTT
jgi:hypothetical protein